MHFRYQCLVGRGRRETGQIEAEHRVDAIQQLLNRGLYVIELEEVRPSLLTMEIQFGKHKVAQSDFVVFCRQFATLVRAGIPLVESLQVLMQQTRNKRFKATLLDVCDHVTDGTALSDSFALHPRIFPNMFVQMVRAGEISGTLDEILESMATYTEKQQETAEKVKSALVYPISVSVFAMFVCIFLLVRVIPTFVTVFHSQHLVLPLPTQVILALSSIATHQWYYGLIALVIVLFGIFVLSRIERVTMWKDRYVLRIPVFGQLSHKVNIARTARTMALLFRSTVPVLQTMSITADVVSNRYIAATLRDARDSVQDGKALYARLAESDAFPPMLTQMIRVGEQTGSLDEMLSKIADFYEGDVETMADRLRQLIEPIMIVFLAVVVGGIVLSAILPMFSLYQNMGNMT